MKIDYSQEKYWFEFSSQYIGKEIDIFYVYPTINSEPLSNKGDVPCYTDISKPQVRKAATKNQSYNKTVYAAGDFNFFAPYYRQMTTKVFAMSQKEHKQKAKLSFGDIKNAFQYYMEHFNQGRPFILLGHSQGSLMLLELLKRGMTESQFGQMVAAYLMGYEITEKVLKKFPDRLKPATGELDKGCIISYNSVTTLNAISPLLARTQVCINPLNWKTDGSFASKDLHKGIVRFSKEKRAYATTPHYTGARIENHFLVCEDVDPNVCYDEKIKEPFPFGNLHFADSWLFAENIKENMRKRAGLEK
ncbi:MAG: DUF3089 domain-containing protein [Paludibacteraceae bacterium]|nr:DUF3089 domain-containing protein [Paludibacteraceae bacterium]